MLWKKDEQVNVCPECGDISLVLDARTACCGVNPNINPQVYKQMSEPPSRRRFPPRYIRDEKLAAQQNCCFYCDRKFGSVQEVGDREFYIHIQWDHQIPFAFRQDNSAENVVAACQKCNGWKTDRLFDTVQEARDFLALRWRRYLQRGLSPRHIRRLTILLDIA